jgi:NADH:ubiquinone oxidoreductase subunit 6 (subunit J)
MKVVFHNLFPSWWTEAEVKAWLVGPMEPTKFNIVKPTYLLVLVLSMITSWLAVLSFRFGELNYINLFFESIFCHINVYCNFLPWDWFSQFEHTAQEIQTHLNTLLYNKELRFQYDGLTLAEQIEFLSLLDLLYENFISLEEVRIFLENVDKYNQIFNFSFLNTYFLQNFTLVDLVDHQFTSNHLLNHTPQSQLDVFFLFTTSTTKNINSLEQYRVVKFLASQLSFLQLAMLFLKKKVLLFFLSNLILICIMFWNLTNLCNAANLIYSLLHFLFFAVTSALLILLWGASYIAFCVILIYGAAIPVLALYIIMLVNVDLLQWLFFVEYIDSQDPKQRLLKWRITIVSIVVIFASFWQSIDFFFTGPRTFLDEFNSDMAYFLLVKWYLQTLEIMYSVDNIYDLPLLFYTSDIDKVAVAAFKISYNELLALVLLLLVAIIVVISISWPSSVHSLPNHYILTFTPTDFHLFALLNLTVEVGELVQFYIIEKIFSFQIIWTITSNYKIFFWDPIISYHEHYISESLKNPTEEPLSLYELVERSFKLKEITNDVEVSKTHLKRYGLFHFFTNIVFCSVKQKTILFSQTFEEFLATPKDLKLPPKLANYLGINDSDTTIEQPTLSSCKDISPKH